MDSERLQKIKEKNKRFERESPYNFCDRWCERCPDETQKHCRLYQDEFEQKITCIAHGKETDDPELTKEIFTKQYEEVEKNIEQYNESHDIEMDETDTDEITHASESANEHCLQKTTMQYMIKTHEFLKRTFYKEKTTHPKISHDLETINWYHTLLPAKMKRALFDLHLPDEEHEFGLCDAVAQFATCKKALRQSSDAFARIESEYPDFKRQIHELLALLGNIVSRIQHIEDGI